MASESVSGEVVGGEEPVPPRAKVGLTTTILLCLLVYLPGFFGVPPTNIEARYAQAARQVYESVAFAPGRRDPDRHHILVPRFQDQPLTGNPPLAVWAQAAGAAVFSTGNPYRDALWMYRLPSLFAAMVLVILTRRLGGAMFDLGAGRVAAIFIALCPIVLWQARQGTPDMVGAGLIAGAMWFMWRAFSPLDRRLGIAGAMAFWLLLAAAALSIGWIAVITIGGAAATLWILNGPRTLADLRPLIGLPAFGAILAIYVLAAGRHAGVDAILTGSLHYLAWGDSGFVPPGVYTIAAPVLYWPGTLLVPAGLLVMWQLGRTRGMEDAHPGYTFLLAWLIPTWIVLELLPGKSAGRALLLAAPLAIIGGRAVLAATAQSLPGLDSRASRFGNTIWLIAGAAIVFAGASLIALRLIAWPGSSLALFGALLIGCLAVLVNFRALGAAWRSILRSKFARAAIAGVGVMFITAIIVPTLALPRLLGLPRDLAAAIDGIDPSGSRPVAALDLQSPSLVFLTRGRLIELEASNAANWLASNPGGLLIREPDGARPRAVVSGFDTTEWRARELVIEGPPP